MKMSETMANKEVTDQILSALSDKLESVFGTRPDSTTTLQLAKDLKFVKGRQGRGGGTFPEQAGYAFLTSVSAPEDESEVSETVSDNTFTLLNQENDDTIPF